MRRRNRNKKQGKIVIGTALCLLLIMTTGYAAFSTNLTLSAKGNIKDYNAAYQLKKKVVSSGAGLYNDSYENNRFIYKGLNPNNYIKYNNELWRIISIESDDTLKIIKEDYLETSEVWDRNKLLIWESATLNSYLNSTYYEGISVFDKSKIEKHSFNIGFLKNNSEQLLETDIIQEKSTTWNGNIGLISVSDFIRASNDLGCLGVNKSGGISKPCKNNNYLYKEYWWWTINRGSTPTATSDWNGIWFISSEGHAGLDSSYGVTEKIRPSLFLNANIKLSGDGTENNPYIIK